MEEIETSYEDGSDEKETNMSTRTRVQQRTPGFHELLLSEAEKIGAQKEETPPIVRQASVVQSWQALRNQRLHAKLHGEIVPPLTEAEEELKKKAELAILRRKKGDGLRRRDLHERLNPAV